MFWKRILGLGLFALACFGFVQILQPSSAPDAGNRAEGEVFTLVFASPNSPRSPFGKADLAWMEKITAESGGRIKFQPFWSGTLISQPNAIEELEAGVADLAVIHPTFTRAGMHTIKGSMSYYSGTDTREEAEAMFWYLWERYPEFSSELSGVKVITAHSGTPMFVQTVNVPVRSLDDMAGLRLKTSPEKMRPLRELSVDPVTMPMGEAYIALHRGILDGAIAPPDTIIAVSFDEVIRYIAKFPNPRPPYPSRAFNRQAWEALPADLQQLIVDSGPWWSDQIYAEIEAFDRKAVARAEDAGIEFVEPAPDQVSRYKALLAAEADQVAKELDARGLPGSAMLQDARAFTAQEQTP